MLPNLTLLQRLPKWAYIPLLILLIPAAAGTIYLTRDYAISNLNLLNLDAQSRASRQLSIDVLLYVHVVAFLVAPILFDTRLKWRRRQLMALGLAIWLFDCATLYQSRAGIMISADSVQTTAQEKAKKKQESIDSLRRQAKKLQDLAATQLSLNRVKAATETTAEATALEKEANKKATELEKEPTGTGLTEVKVWGEAARYKALVESLLISAGTLVLLGLVGAIGRVMLERVAPDVERAAAAFELPKNAPLKRRMGRMLRGALAALGIGAAAATATAGEAPKAPGATPAATLSQPVNDDGSKGVRGVNVDTPIPSDDEGSDGGSKGSAAPVNVDGSGGAGGVNVDGSAPVNVDTPEKAQKARKARVRDASTVMDSGVGPHDGTRYRRALAGVKARQFRPSLEGLATGVQASAPVARRYLAAMAEAGEIVPGANGRGWVLAPGKGAKK